MYKIKIILISLLVLILGFFFLWTAFLRPEKPEQKVVLSTPSFEINTPNLKQSNKDFSVITKPIIEQEPISLIEPFKKITETIIPPIITHLTIPETQVPFAEQTPPELPIKPTSTPEIIQKPDLSFLEELSESTLTLETTTEKKIEITDNLYSGSLPSPDTLSTTISIDVSFTEEEFHYLYPDVFIDNLMETQNILKQFYPSYKSIEKIETDAHVRYIQESLVTAFFTSGMITREEAEVFITTIRFTLPQIQLIELQYAPMSLLDKTKYSVENTKKGLFFAGLLSNFLNSFISKAEAGVCGYCYYSPQCFQSGGSSGAGMNVFKTFCYCTGCYYGQGCLDFCTGRAAIWDPTTGICGCG